MGYRFQTGDGVEKSYVRAAALYKLAADMGDARSNSLLGSLYEDGLGVERSYEKAAQFYKAAADAGDPDGLCGLGNLHAGGMGVQQSDKEAVRLFRRAAYGGSAWGQRNLGYMYENGRGVPQSDEIAMNMYKMAAEKGDAFAKNRLAAMSVNAAPANKERNIRECMLDRAPGAEREADELIRTVECLLHSGVISEEEANGILSAATGASVRVSLRTTKGLSVRMLRLIGRFNSSADYFIDWPYESIAWANMDCNNPDNMEKYSEQYIMSLKAPLIYSAGELGIILGAMEDLERGICPAWNEF